MMTTLLDVLDLIGRTTWEPLWVPVLAWTALALPLSLLLKRTDRLHPRAEYRLSQVLLVALPVGLLATTLADLLPGSMAVGAARPFSVTVLPAAEASSVTTSAASPWQWTQAVGSFTVAASAVTLVSVGRLVLDAVAALRVRTSLEGTCPPSIQSQAARIAHRLGTRRPLQVCLSPSAAVPLTLGGLRPTILLPADLADDPEALHMTLVHECIHVRRYDDLAHLLERIVSAVFAAHPLVGRLQRHAAEMREQACDAAVLADDKHSSADYARLLLAFADGPPLQGLDALSLSESPSSLTNRLRVMHSSVSAGLSSHLGLGTTLLTAGLFLTLGVVACSESVGPSSESSTDPEAPATTESPTNVYTDVTDLENPPDCGGVRALSEKIQYPDVAKKAGIEGRVFVQFIVGETGMVVEPTIKKGTHETLNKAALTAMKRLECKPGRKRGKPVKVQMSVPVTFRLDEPENDPVGSSESAGTSGARPKTDSGGRLFEKAGIQVVRVLMNEEGDLLIDDEPVVGSNLTDAVRQRLTQDAARATLLYADGAPTERVDAAEAKLRALNFQKVYVQKVE